MTTYLVTLPEIYQRIVKIEADNPDEALGGVANREGTQVTMEFVKTLDVAQWIVEEIPEDREDV
jgi:hypothetical protein